MRNVLSVITALTCAVGIVCVSSLWWALGDLSLRDFGRAAPEDKAHHFWHWNVQDPWDLIFDRFPVFYIYCINQLSATQYFLLCSKFAPRQRGGFSLKHRRKVWVK